MFLKCAKKGKKLRKNANSIRRISKACIFVMAVFKSEWKVPYPEEVSTVKMVMNFHSGKYVHFLVPVKYALVLVHLHWLYLAAKHTIMCLDYT